MYSIWDQLAQSEPRWKHSDDAKLFITYRDHQRLLQFLMALDNTFEPVRASLLHRLPLPTLEQAVSELISEETRFGTLKIQNIESVMASTFKPQNMNSVMATPQSRSFSQRTCPYCSNRRLPANHSLEKCQVRKCLSCHKIAPGHLQSNYPQITGTESSRSRYKFKPFPASRSAAAAGSEGSSSSSHIESSTPSFSMDDVASIIKHMMSTGTTSSPSIALSATSGTSSWFFDSACCNHMTSDIDAFSSKTSSSSIPSIYTADGSNMTVSHIGHISTPNVSLPETYHIPALTLNLISVGQLCELGLKVIFSGNGCLVQDPLTRQTLGIGRRHGRLFELIYLRIPSTYIAASASTSATSNFSLWHCRLGHVSYGRLKTLIS